MTKPASSSTEIKSPPGHLWFWAAVLVGFVLLMWLFSGILAPFLIAMLLAYLLDPPVRRLSAAGVPRTLSAAMVLILFVLVVAAAIVFLGPLVQSQAHEFIASLPAMLEKAQGYVWPRIERLLDVIPGVSSEQVKTALAQRSGEGLDIAGTVLGRVAKGGWAFINSLTYVVLTPVIAFYLLRDWQVMLGAIDHVLPKRYAPAIRREAGAVDAMISGFVRGQATVSLCLALFYAVSLHLTGLQYGVLLGLGIGVMSFIPMIGTLIGAVLALVMSLLQFDSASGILAVAGVFLAGQVLDGYLLTPNLVGSRVGLHPVWIIFAVFAGGYLFGFLGVLFGVPVAGTIAILLRLAIKLYRDSDFFKAQGG